MAYCKDSIIDKVRLIAIEINMLGVVSKVRRSSFDRYDKGVHTTRTKSLFTVWKLHIIKLNLELTDPDLGCTCFYEMFVRLLSKSHKTIFFRKKKQRIVASYVSPSAILHLNSVFCFVVSLLSNVINFIVSGKLLTRQDRG